VPVCDWRNIAITLIEVAMFSQFGLSPPAAVGSADSKVDAPAAHAATRSARARSSISTAARWSELETIA
jgi:hypothetical protein